MVLPVVVILVLVAINALYVAAEFSAVAAQRGRIAQLAEEGNRRAKRLLALLQDGAQVDRYIAACQIGITLSSIGAGAYGQATIGRELAPRLAAWLELSPEAAISTSAVVVLLVLTALQVVLGELVPKSLALQFPERAALVTFLPTSGSAKVLRGVIWLLNGSGFLLLKPFGVKPGGHQHVHSPEEIRLLIAESSRGGEMSPEMSRRLERGLRLSQRVVRDVMVPCDQIDVIVLDTPPNEILTRIVATPYSRLVVYRGSLRNVIGTVGVKDLVGLYAERGAIPLLAEVVRPITVVQETTRAEQLVRTLQDRHSSKAIVVDGDGEVKGFVSINDVLADLFGELGDAGEVPA